MAVPWHLKGKPFEAQSVALNAGAGKKGWGYFMEVGLGKTGVAHNEAIDLFMKDQIAGQIVIAPSEVMSNWKDEAELLGFKGDTFLWPDVKQLNVNRLFSAVINYEALITKGFQEFMDGIVKQTNGALHYVSEECTRIKNHKAQRTGVALYYSKQCRYTRALTGMPVTENVAGLWSPLTFIKAIDSLFYQFRNTFCLTGGHKGKEITGAKNLPQLNRLLDRCSISMDKADWTDLPEQSWDKRVSGLAGEQKSAYATMQEEFYALIRDKEVSVDMAITQQMKLQQIVSGFLIDNEENVTHEFYSKPEKIPKMMALEGLIEEVRGKIIVFCFFRQSIKNVMKVFAHLNPVAIMGVGKNRDERKDEMDRTEARHTFNENPKCRMAVVQINSGIGITLLGQPKQHRCRTSIFYENVFSSEGRRQAEGRNHRHGQDMPVTYFDFVSTSIEARMINALQKKQDLAKIIRDPLLWKPQA